MRNNSVRKLRGKSREKVEPAPVETRKIDPRVWRAALHKVGGDKSRIKPDPDNENSVIIT